MWVKRIPCLAWVIPSSTDGHFSFLSPCSNVANESPVWWVSPIWTSYIRPKNGKPRLKRQGSPKRCGTCSFSASSRICNHNSQVSNLSMAGGCYVPMSQVSAPKNGWLSRLSFFVEVSWVRNFHPDRPCLYLDFQKPSKKGLQKKIQYVQAH